LVALISARERSSDYALAKGGLQGQGKPLMIYTSAQAHSSVDKAALLAGFGKDNIRYIETDDHFAMRPQALAAAIEEDLANGL
ncbi:aspartate aminotransferase family protein, partial [Pseudomonas frederiksbergensis]|nr:aspartate aminotransferase family protein [Pseudomonas frederiksbergensis]